MASRTATKKKVPAEPSVTPVGPATGERRYASRTSIPEVSYTEVQMSWGDWVKIRVLDTPDIIGLAILPDMTNFASLSMKIASLQEDQDLPMDDKAAFATENYKYMCLVAHVAVVDHDKAGQVTRCPDCDLEHEVSLWTWRQTRRLNLMDVKHIADEALSSTVAADVAPFSKVAVDSSTPLPVDIGESTPDETS